MATVFDKIGVKGHLGVLPKPLPHILDEMEGNIRAAAEAAQRAEAAARQANQAGLAAARASGEAEKRAIEAREAGEKAAETATRAAAEAAAKAEEASSNAIKICEATILRIESLEQRLNNIENAMPREEVIVLREITREEAKIEIERLFTKGDTLYYSDIAKKLRLDLELVVNICEELFKEGKVRVEDRP